MCAQPAVASSTHCPAYLDMPAAYCSAEAASLPLQEPAAQRHAQRWDAQGCRGVLGAVQNSCKQVGHARPWRRSEAKFRDSGAQHCSR